MKRFEGAGRAGRVIFALLLCVMVTGGCRLAMVRDREVSYHAALGLEDDRIYELALVWAERTARERRGEVFFRDPGERRISFRGNASLNAGPERLDFDYVLTIQVADGQFRISVREIPYTASARLRDEIDASFRALFRQCHDDLRAAAR